MKTISRLMVAGILAFMLFSCNDEPSEYDKQVNDDNSVLSNYISSNNINAHEASNGYYIEILDESSNGAALQSGDVVQFYYTISDLDKTFTESYSDTSNPPKLFQLGTSGIWPYGLDDGISNMKIGDEFRFYLPSYLAFFDYEHVNYFPAFSNLIVDIKVVGVLEEADLYEQNVDSIKAYLEKNTKNDTSEAYASGLHYIEIEKGDGDMPVVDDLVTIHFTRKYLDGTINRDTQDGNPVSFYIGSDNAIEGLQSGLRLMREGGKAILIIPSNIAFGRSLQVLPSGLRGELYDDRVLLYDIEPYSPLLYEVELIDVK